MFPSPNLRLSLKYEYFSEMDDDDMFPSPNLGLSLKGICLIICLVLLEKFPSPNLGLSLKFIILPLMVVAGIVSVP